MIFDSQSRSARALLSVSSCFFTSFFSCASVSNGPTVEANLSSSFGSTTSFTLNELVHEEEIKLRENATVLSFGQQVTADNTLSPTYLSADSLLRSVDYEPQFSLSHDTVNEKTTINFTNAPTATSKIRVERKGDKYLAFKKKLKE